MAAFSFSDGGAPVRIAVLGGGSWATAIVKMLSENNVRINWWMRSKEDIDFIRKNHRNPRYLSSALLNIDKITPLNDVKAVIADSKYIVLAVPSAFITDVFEKLDPTTFKDKVIVSAIKGMILEENVLVTEHVQKIFNVPCDKLLTIAGPCHAEEVAQERQAYLTIGGDEDEGDKFAKLLRGHYIKCRTNPDLNGIQYCAVIKNVVAVACGMARGLNYGDNFQAVLVSNAMQEAKRFLDKAYPLKERDINASAYLGDLLVTSYSQFSRNRTFGNMVGRGYTVKSAQIEMGMVAEGYYAVKGLYEVTKQHKVDMPIIKAVYNTLYEKISPAIEFRILKDSLQ